VNSLPKTVTRQNSGCDLNPGVSAPESSTVANHSATERSWWGRGANVRYLSNAPAAVYLSIRVINSPIERLVDPMPKTGTTTGLVEEAVVLLTGWHSQARINGPEGEFCV